MKEFIRAIDDLPLIVKIILCIPALHLVWAIYRIIASLNENNTTGLIISIVLCFIPIMWIIDLVTLILYGKVWRYTAAA